jgi:hypothetical protein
MVTDLSPLRELPALRKLFIDGSIAEDSPVLGELRAHGVEVTSFGGKIQVPLN